METLNKEELADLLEEADVDEVHALKKELILLSMFKMSHLGFNFSYVNVGVDSAWLDSFFRRFYN